MHYRDPILGEVNYDPKILALESLQDENVLWFTYWIATSRTAGKMKWGQGSPMLEENVFLSLIRDAIRQGLFSRGLLKGLSKEVGSSLGKKRQSRQQSDRQNALTIFDRQRHQFRDDLGHAYMCMKSIVGKAYSEDYDQWFGFDHSGWDVGHFSNMQVIHVWTLFEELMRNAFVAVHGNYSRESDDFIRKNYGWGKMREWLNDKGMFTDDLRRFQPLIGELDARRNCLVHNNGFVDNRYLVQTFEYGGETDFNLNDRIWTDWHYHQQLETQLRHFQNWMGAEVGKYLGWGGRTPTFNITDVRLYRTALGVWEKLPLGVKTVLLNTVESISEVPEWDTNTKQTLKNLGIAKNYAKWQQPGAAPKGEIKISSSDCATVSNEIVAGSLMHELGHAYQTAETPRDVDAIENAGDTLPTQWGFTKEIEALQKQRAKDHLGNPS
jgi:hypothetical protein